MADDGSGSNDDAIVDSDNRQYCKIYDKEDFFTVLVQLLLAFLALCSLWIKRTQEVPRRKFWTWFMDVFKQGLGACYAHVLNMVRCCVHGCFLIFMIFIPGSISLAENWGQSTGVGSYLWLFLNSLGISPINDAHTGDCGSPFEEYERRG